MEEQSKSLAGGHYMKGSEESQFNKGKGEGGCLVDFLCSRNARPQKNGKGAARPSFLLAEPPR